MMKKFYTLYIEISAHYAAVYMVIKTIKHFYYCDYNNCDSITKRTQMKKHKIRQT